jgi:hypothetical protein
MNMTTSTEKFTERFEFERATSFDSLALFLQYEPTRDVVEAADEPRADAYDNLYLVPG